MSSIPPRVAEVIRRLALHAMHEAEGLAAGEARDLHRVAARLLADAVTLVCEVREASEVGRQELSCSDVRTMQSPAVPVTAAMDISRREDLVCAAEGGHRNPSRAVSYAG
jgi:hypothetical protein